MSENIVGCVYTLENTYLNGYAQPQILIGVVTGKHALHALCATNIDGTVFRYTEPIEYSFDPFEDFVEHVLEQNTHFCNLMERKQVRLDTHTLFITNNVFNKLNKTRVGRREIDMTAWTYDMINGASNATPIRVYDEDSPPEDTKIARIRLIRKTYIKENMRKYNLKYKEKINSIEEYRGKGVAPVRNKRLSVTVNKVGAHITPSRHETEVLITIKDRGGNRLQQARVLVYRDNILVCDAVSDSSGRVRLNLQHLPGGSISIPTSMRIVVNAGIAYCNKEVLWNITSEEGYRGVIVVDSAPIYAPIEMVEEEVTEGEVIEDV